jgi:ribonuclease D
MAWKGPVKILNEPKEMADAVAMLLQEDYLGFDVEAKPCFVRGHYEPPALVQVAGKDCVYIFQIVRGGVWLKALLPLLECARVLKVGVGVKGDILALQKVLSFSPRGFVELSERTKKLGYVNQGLRALTALLLGGNLSKKQQMSNWAKPSLTEGQIKYAATDAWVGREMYTRVLQEEAGGAHDGAT